MNAVFYQLSKWMQWTSLARTLNVTKSRPGWTTGCWGQGGVCAPCGAVMTVEPPGTKGEESLPAGVVAQKGLMVRRRVDFISPLFSTAAELC